MIPNEHRDDELARFLDGLGEEQQAELEAARRAAGSSQPGRAEAHLESLMAAELDGDSDRLGATQQPDELAAARIRRLRPWTGLAAAAVLLALGWGLREWSQPAEPRTPPETTLGVRVVALSPAGATREAWAEFRFDSEMGPDVWARITVRNADNADESVTSGRLAEAVWSAGATERAQMAGWERIEWWVDVYTGSTAAVSLGTSEPVLAEHSSD